MNRYSIGRLIHIRTHWLPRSAALRPWYGCT